MYKSMVMKVLLVLLLQLSSAFSQLSSAFTMIS
jgi:hypothetical protein